MKKRNKCRCTAEPLFRALHGFAALAHIAACVTVFAFFVQDEFPLDLRLRRKDPSILENYTNPVCNGTRYEASEFRDWLECVRDSYPDDIGDAVTYSVKDYVSPWKGGIAILIICFTLITAMFHMWCAFNVDTYVRRLFQENQPVRWIEYSITYTIMTVCIFQLNEIDGMYETALLIVSGIAQMFIGLAIEVIRRKMPVTQKTFFGQVCEAWSQFRQGVYEDIVAVALLEMTACMIMLFHFIIIWDSFRLAFLPYLESDAGELFAQLYGYIIVLNAVIYVLYLGFPIVHACVFFKHGTRNAYIYGEIGYVILSLTSKLFLVGIVTFGARRQR